MNLTEPENERARANVDHYRNMLTPEELDNGDELVMKNEPAMETWRTSKEFLDYQRLCRGEVTQVSTNMESWGTSILKSFWITRAV